MYDSNNEIPTFYQFNRFSGTNIHDSLLEKWGIMGVLSKKVNTKNIMHTRR